MRVGAELGKSLEELGRMSPDEIGRWMAYFAILDEIKASATKKGRARGNQPR